MLITHDVSLHIPICYNQPIATIYFDVLNQPMVTTETYRNHFRLQLAPEIPEAVETCPKRSMSRRTNSVTGRNMKHIFVPLKQHTSNLLDEFAFVYNLFLVKLGMCLICLPLIKMIAEPHDC